MQHHVNAIIFDLGGVILNLDYNLTVNAFKSLGKENFEKLYTQSQQEGIFDLFETGKISASEFRRYMKSFISPEVSDSEIDLAWNAMLLDLPESRIALLKQLKKDFRIFLFSNTNEIHFSAFRSIIRSQYQNENLLDELFDRTYYSHLVGERKPNASAFMKVIGEQSLNPSETLFIDDSLQHVEGAKKLGVQTIHLFNRDITEIDYDVFLKQH